MEQQRYDNIETALDALRDGGLIMVIDDPDRENEGDLICAAEHATAANINFMASHAKGLICMPMDRSLAKRFDLEPMTTRNTDNHGTAFTVSIDHRSTTTGISAFDRSVTAMACADENAAADDFRRPGHMFPLVARDGGVLERPGHTEATVDLCRLAGLKPVGLCCEIMADDGTMMRAPELLDRARAWHIPVITIAALADWRRAHDRLVDRVTSVTLPTRFGMFIAHGYVNRITGGHHVALVKGDIGDGRNLLVRVHSECLTGDVFGSLRCDCGPQFAAAMQAIESEGRGVLLYMRQEGRGHRADQQAQGICIAGTGA